MFFQKSREYCFVLKFRMGTTLYFSKERNNFWGRSLKRDEKETMANWGQTSAGGVGDSEWSRRKESLVIEILL